MMLEVNKDLPWYNRLEKFVEDLLSSQSDLSPSRPKTKKRKEGRKVLTLRKLPEQLPEWPETLEERKLFTFSVLSHFYVGGLMIRRQGGENQLFASFLNGRIEQAERQVLKGVPYVERGKVLKARRLRFLDQLKTDFLHSHENVSAFLMAADEETLYCLFSDLPNLWLYDHVEITHEIVRGAFDER